MVVSIANEPSPSRTEVVGCLLGELGLEGVEGTPGLYDEVVQLSLGLTSSIGRHGLPVEGMVPDLHTTVVHVLAIENAQSISRRQLCHAQKSKKRSNSLVASQTLPNAQFTDVPVRPC